MSDLDAIDRLARGTSAIHRARPGAKLAGGFAGLLGAASAPDGATVAAIAGLWLGLAAVARLPLRRLAGLLAYAASFAALYLLATWEGDPRASLAALGRVGTATLVVLVVALTTPSPELFRALRPVLPDLLADTLYLAYRSFFLLLDRWFHVRTALGLRGGLERRHPLRALGNLAQGLGVVFLGAMDRSEALHVAMRLRGFRGRLVGPAPARWNRESAWPLVVGAASLVAALGRPATSAARALWGAP